MVSKTAARHTSQEFVAFLAAVVANQPRGKEIHLIADNLSAHKTQRVEQFLAAHPRVHLHYTPTYSSWLNQVENWFARLSAMLSPAESSLRSRTWRANLNAISVTTIAPPNQSSGPTVIPRIVSLPIPLHSLQATSGRPRGPCGFALEAQRQHQQDFTAAQSSA